MQKMFLLILGYAQRIVIRLDLKLDMTRTCPGHLDASVSSVGLKLGISRIFLGPCYSLLAPLESRHINVVAVN